MIIIDGSSVMFRSAYAKTADILVGSTNVAPIKAFIQYVLWLAGEFDPSDGIIVAWDRKLVQGTKSFRKTLAGSLIGEAVYKSNRTHTGTSENVYKCCDLVPTFLQHLGVKSLYPHSLEADDIIAWAIRNLPYKTATIISGDSDLWQLIGPRVNFYSPVKRELTTDESFKTKMGFPVDKYLLFKCLKGDTSDCIPGVSGMGEVRSRKYVQEFNGTHTSPEIESIVERNMQLMDLTYCLSQCAEDVAQLEAQMEAQKDVKVSIPKFTEAVTPYELGDLVSPSNLSKIRDRLEVHQQADDLESLLAQAFA